MYSFFFYAHPSSFQRQKNLRFILDYSWPTIFPGCHFSPSSINLPRNVSESPILHYGLLDYGHQPHCSSAESTELNEAWKQGARHPCLPGTVQVLKWKVHIQGALPAKAQPQVLSVILLISLGISLLPLPAPAHWPLSSPSTLALCLSSCRPHRLVFSRGCLSDHDPYPAHVNPWPCSDLIVLFTFPSWSSIWSCVLSA